MPQPNRLETILFVSFLAWALLVGPLMMYLAGEHRLQLTKLVYAAGVVMLFIPAIGSYVARIIREYGISMLIFTLFWIAITILLSFLLRSLFSGS